MKNIFFLLCLFLMMSAVQSLYAEKSEKRTLPAFSEISLKASATIHLTQGNDQKVELTGDNESIDKMITEVKDGQLIIRYPGERRSWLHKDEKMDIRITVPGIQYIEITGAGSILADKVIHSKNLELKISGVGNLKFSNLIAEKISVHISGTGNILLASEQTAAELNSSISGTGSLKASDFPADEVKVSVSGTGNCWISANKNLDVRISGMGVVHYHGNPEIKSNISGMGHLSREK